MAAKYEKKDYGDISGLSQRRGMTVEDKGDGPAEAADASEKTNNHNGVSADRGSTHTGRCRTGTI